MSGLESFFNMIAPKAIGHFAAGIALALGDRLLSSPRPTSRRMQAIRRLDALKILAYLRDLDRDGPVDAGPDGDVPSADEIREAGEYLRLEAGAGNLALATLGGRQPPAAAGLRGEPLADVRGSSDGDAADLAARAEGVWERVLTWLRHEKINQLRPLTKLKVGYIIEIGADVIQGLAQLFWGRGNFFPALAHSLYQGAALGLGLIIGGFCFRRRDHRVPRRVRKALERLEEDLSADPRALSLLDRIVRGETPVLGAPRPDEDVAPSLPTHDTTRPDDAR